MKNNPLKLGAVLAALFVLLAAAPAWAETITAQVMSLDEKNRSLEARPVSPKEGLPAKIKLSLAADTKLEGFKSLGELETGDEIRFEGIKMGGNEYKVSRLEAREGQGAQKALNDFREERDDAREELDETRQDLGQARDQAKDAAQAQGERKGRPDMFENVKQQVKGAWYEFRYSVQADPQVYQQYAEKRAQILEDRFNHLKREPAGQSAEDAQPREPRDSAVFQQELAEIEAQLAKTRQLLGALKDSGQNEQAWQEAKSNFEAAINDLDDMIEDAGKKVLTEKALYESDVQDRLEDLRYDIQEVEAVARSIKTPEVSEKDAQPLVDKVNEKFREAEGSFKNIQSADESNWASQKAEMENKFYTARGAYYDLLSKVGA